MAHRKVAAGFIVQMPVGRRADPALVGLYGQPLSDELSQYEHRGLRLLVWVMHCSMPRCAGLNPPRRSTPGTSSAWPTGRLLDSAVVMSVDGITA